MYRELCTGAKDLVGLEPLYRGDENAKQRRSMYRDTEKDAEIDVFYLRYRY